ncbi:MAG: T9SS type A sorting domain-containing protein [Chloroflexota bacterium]
MYDFFKYYIILLIFAGVSIVRGEDLIITGVTYDKYPALEARFYYFDDSGAPADINGGDLSLIYNSIDNPNFQFVKGGAGEFNRPILIAIDNSESMNPVLPIVKSSLQKFIEAKSAESEIAALSFGRFVARLSGFAKDKQGLFRALKLGEGYSVSSVSDAFYDVDAGAFALDASRKSSAILITNGLTLLDSKVNEIYKKARALGIEINVINLSGVYSKKLNELADSSGGLHFFDLKSENELTNALFAIRARSNSIAPNIIQFLALDCERNPGITIKHTNGASASLLASVPQNVVPTIGYGTGQTVDFGVVSAPSEKPIEIIARGGDIFIDSVVSSNPKFRVIDFQPGYLLKEGDKLEITTRYIPTDTNFEFATVSIYANLCEKAEYYCAGGGREAIVKKNLKVTHPNEGEKFLAGSVIDLTWLGVSEADSIHLEYSIDGGAHWIPLLPGVAGGSRKWKTPRVESRNCLIRVKKLSEKPDMSKILVLNKHKEKITSVAWRADSKQIATAGLDGSILIWDAETGKNIDSLFPSIKKPIQSIAWSPDGKYMALVALSNSIKIWNVELDYQETELTGGAADISLIRWSPWGADVFATDYSGVLYRWTNLASEPRYAEKIHDGEIKDFEINPSGENIATAGADGKVNIVDYQTGAFKKTLYQSALPINGIAFSPMGNNIAIANGSSETSVYDVSNGAKVVSLFDFVQPVVDVDWSSDRDNIATISSDKTVKLWEVGSGSSWYSYPLHKNQPNLIKFNKNGSRIASVEPGAEAHIWSPYDAPFEKKTLESDESDTTFAILPANLKVERIYIPVVAVGETASFVKADALRNLSEVALRIDSIAVTGDTKNAFQIVSDSPITMNPNEIASAVIRFTPTASLLYLDTLVAYTEAGTFSAEIFAQGSNQFFDSLTSVIDFGNVLPGKFRDSTVFLLKKRYQSDLEISGIKLLNPSETAFTYGDYDKILNQDNPDLSMDVKFAPLQYGDYSQTMEISFKGSPVKAYALFKGNSGEASLSAPSEFDLGLAVCGDSIGGRVILRNTGSETIEIDSVRIPNENSAFSAIGNYSGVKIEQGQQAPIEVAFISAQSGSFSARLEIYANKRPKYITSVILRAKRVIPSFKLNSDRIDLVKVEAGKEQSGAFSIKNDGDAALRLDYTIDSDKFEIKSPAEPILIGLGDSIDVQFAFKGAPSGFYEAKARFIDSCGNAREILFTASIGEPDARITEVEPLGTDTISCPEATDIFYKVKNSGTTLLKIDSLTFTPENQNSFSVVSLPGAIKPDSTAEIIFRYLPAAEGVTAAIATIHSNAVNVPEGKFSAQLNSIYLPYNFAINNKELEFGKAPSGTTDTLTFTISNLGEIYLKAILRPPGESFAILEPSQITIAPGGAVEARVEFRPAAPDREYLDSAIVELPCGESVVLHFRGESVKPLPVDTTITLIDTSGRIALSHIYANPNRGDFNIQYFVPKASEIELEVVDLLGSRIALLERGTFPRGIYKRGYSVRGVASGVYFLRLSSGNTSLVRRLYIIK